MRFFKFFFLSITLIFILGCSGNKGFDFDQKWTWQQLSNFSQNENTQKHIAFLKKELSQEEGYFLFSTINKIKKPTDVLQFIELQKNQIALGGSFNNILPSFFQDSTTLPIPDNFDNTVALAFYLARIRYVNIRSIMTSRIGYNLKFTNNEITDIERDKKFLDVAINTDDIQYILELLDKKKIKKSDLTKVENLTSIKNMIKYRQDNYISSDPLPTTQSISQFIVNASTEKPLNILWNWINPVNNFGFSDLYVNREDYKKFINFISENKEIFKDRLLKRIELFLMKDVTYKPEIEFGVNFGLKSWASDNYIGLNIVHIKDNYGFYFFELRKQIISQLYPKIILKSPDFDEKNKNNVNPENIDYWKFKNDKDNEFYQILTFIHYHGMMNFVAGKPLGFDYIMQAKESRSFINQIHGLIYGKRNDNLFESTKKYVMGEYGAFTGLGYFMARNMGKEFGTEVMAKCLNNGPVYFFHQYLEFQTIKKSARFQYFDEKFAEKINELYEIQSPYYK